MVNRADKVSRLHIAFCRVRVRNKAKRNTFGQASRKGQVSTFIVALEWIAGILDPMARKLRLEYPGAIYHVINRGNNVNV